MVGPGDPGAWWVCATTPQLLISFVPPKSNKCAPGFHPRPKGGWSRAAEKHGYRCWLDDGKAAKDWSTTSELEDRNRSLPTTQRRKDQV
mmetsp:Transcript_47819/g.74649  ORF Transcript_47819/g.74649 Transcript_47819/m.74649 type:complete len:89 (-) Transcript_47819:323-589(-)